MSAVVFAGPTIKAADVVAVLPDADVLPPAGQGDIYRAVRHGACAIGLIDGYFEGVPSVWHKEILWAMEQGIAVYGSASMGALRAAELSAFGMVGVGRIYEAYASGDIMDDDEVAVLHSPAELGYAPLSEPMVSIRATVEHAISCAVLNAAQASAVLKTAKALFYQQRSWAQILADVAAAPWLDRFAAWLETGAVDAKRTDAQEMLHRMAAAEAPADGPAGERMERTLAWQGLVRRAEALEQEQALQAPDQRVLDELRLAPARFDALLNRAALRFVQLQKARRTDAQAGREAVLAQLNRHRQANGLLRSKDLQAWLDANGLTVAQYETVLQETAQAAAAADAVQEELQPYLLAELRLAGAYAGLKSRAEAKEQQLAGQAQPDGPAGQAERLQLAAWHFETCLRQDIPADLEAHAASIGLSVEEFFALIRRELMYHQRCRTRPEPDSND
ncbi:TfuA domain protein, core [Rhodobacteraceae bacterium (ex Bugula neritina AB1)]|nr:TfuA domain protein, core [Rhodobacteraceae bacterium (ex Bugula neritina AB1)]